MAGSLGDLLFRGCNFPSLNEPTQTPTLFLTQAVHAHTLTLIFFSLSYVVQFKLSEQQLHVFSDDSVISQANIPLTQLMFAQTGIPLGQVVLNGRVSYRHITALGD